MSGNRRVRCLWWWTVVLSCWCAVGHAFAQTGDAEALASAAKRARGLAEYGYAIHAYKQLQDARPDPENLFAIADAYHRRSLLEGAPYDRLQALAYYQSYLDAAPSGGMRTRATEAIAELESAALEMDDDAITRAAQAELDATWLAVTSPSLGAAARIDGGRARPLPFFITVEPGKHDVVVSADGYRKETRTLTAVKGLAHALEVSLSPQPATITVVTDDGAKVHVDGQLVGVAPLDKPIHVEPGTRSLSVTLNGHEPHTGEVTLARGASREIEVDLEVTDQRIVAGILMGTGAAGLAAGIAFGVVSIIDHRALRELSPNRSDEERAEYDALVERRDDYRVGSGVAAGIGLSLFLVGGALFILDEPALPETADLVSILPVLGDGVVGVTLTSRF